MTTPLKLVQPVKSERWTFPKYQPTAKRPNDLVMTSSGVVRAMPDGPRPCLRSSHASLSRRIRAAVAIAKGGAA